MNDENKYQHDDCQDYIYQEDVYVFVNQDKPYCGPITKCYGLIFCLFFFPGLFCLPCCLCHGWIIHLFYVQRYASIH